MYTGGNHLYNTASTLTVSRLTQSRPSSRVLLSGCSGILSALFIMYRFHSPNNLLHKISLYHIINNVFLNLHLIQSVWFFFIKCNHNLSGCLALCLNTCFSLSRVLNNYHFYYSSHEQVHFVKLHSEPGTLYLKL